MADYQVEIVFRDLTREQAEQKVGELRDFLFLGSEFEICLMEIFLDHHESGLPSLEHVSHWPENATGPFRDIKWDEDDE
jgi:hypothetical protein